MRRIHPSRVATEVIRRPILLLVAGASLALLFAAAWLVITQAAPKLSQETLAPTRVAAPPAVLPAAGDIAVETWRIPAPRPVVAPAPRRVEPAPDWSALRLSVAAIAPAGTPATRAGAPSGLEVAMSARERRALIATAREPEGLPSPEGYRPGIAVIVPGGSMSDGVCR